MPTPRTRRRWPLLAVLLLFALVATACSSGSDVGVLGSGDSAASSEVPEAQTGGGLATFSYEGRDGSVNFIEERRGTPVVVNFFANWCPPCVAEMPDFEQVHQDTKGKVDFIGLALQSPADRVTALVESTGVTYEIGVDQNGELFKELGGLGMPTTVFIDADGQIARVHSGQLSAESLTAVIDDELLSS
ncbi:MAG: TlpA family protein disulfide reductase [Acidimicrobiales bacterium]|nr:TlpA family protein disulfide reductase [Acidimicrobiales bacterium]